MPEVVIPLVVSLASTTSAAVIAGTAIETAVVQGLVVGGLGVAANLLNKQKASGSLADATPAFTSMGNDARSVAVAQAIPPRRFLYGRVKAGGCEFYANTNNPKLYLGYLYSDGEIDAFESTVYFGSNKCSLDGSGNAAAGTLWAGKLSVETATGTASQAVSAFLAAVYPTVATPTWKQSGVARAVYKLDWGTDAANNGLLWGSGVVPAIMLRGVKVYDPRDPTQTLGTASTYKYSTNPILIVAHAITNAWGNAVPTNKIDWSSVASAANVCDTTVTYNGIATKYFEAAGMFQSGIAMDKQISEMLNACLGSVTFSDGLFKFYADAARTPVWTITDADIIDVRDYVHSQAQDNVPNVIKATYFDVDQDSVGGTTPRFTIPSAIAAEGLHEKTIDLKWSASKVAAQIVAYRMLYRGRADSTCVLWVNDAGLFLNPNDCVTVSSSAFSVINGTWEVVEIEPATDGCLLHLAEYPTASYADPATYLT